MTDQPPDPECTDPECTPPCPITELATELDQKEG